MPPNKNVPQRIRLKRMNNQFQSNNEGGNIGGKGKVHLQKQGNRQQRIQENLKSMKIALQKKKIAQEIYYGHEGQSPLTRGNVIKNSKYKPPVHDRLGGLGGKGNQNKVRLRRVMNNTINNLPPKKKRNLQQNNRNRFRNNAMGNRNQKFSRSFTATAQQRIQNIRRQQQLQNKTGFVPGNQQQYPTQRVRLRRNRPMENNRMLRNRNQMVMNQQAVSLQPKPTFYTLQVNNPGVYESEPSTHGKHSINADLNPQLQAEIKMIQSQNRVHEVIPPLPIHPLGAGFTGKSLNDRFSTL